MMNERDTDKYTKKSDLKYQWLANHIGKHGGFSVAFAGLFAALIIGASFNILLALSSTILVDEVSLGCDDKYTEFRLLMSKNGSAKSDNQKPFIACLGSPDLMHRMTEYGYLTLLILSPVFIFIFWLVSQYHDVISYAEIRKRERELSKRIDTMPPYSAMKEFADVIRLVRQKKTALEDMSGSEEDVLRALKRVIITCLNGINLIVREFHNSGNNHRFASNLMLHKTFDDAFSENDLDLLFGYSATQDLASLRAVSDSYLRLYPEYSSSTDEAYYKVDKGLQDIDVLIPLMRSPNAEKAVPGAALAWAVDAGYFAIFEPQHYFETENCPDLQEDIAAYARNYYKNSKQGKKINSLLSIRLEDESGGDALGILNIHSTRVDMFFNADRRELFVKMLTPILLELHDLARRLKTIKP